MTTPDLFFNTHGRLRSLWRFAAFTLAFVVFALLLAGLLLLLASLLPGQSMAALEDTLGGVLGHLFQAVVLLVSATAVGWACGRIIEDVPWRALGWTRHRGWPRDLIVGALVGGGTLLATVLIAAAAGLFHFSPAPRADWPLVAQTLAVSAFIFLLAAAAEETMFRGYPLQTMLRSLPPWAALIPTSVLFAAVHLQNPHVARGFTFVNTVLAGLWLAVAYIRTRSLWFPLGLHWAWNWAMGAIMGLPVSGITEIAPAPLMIAADRGPAWLTGGAYGIEGGAISTLAFALSTILIWRAPFLSATPELRRLTEEEVPNPPVEKITPA